LQKKLIGLMVILSLTTACAQLSLDEKNRARAEIDLMAKTTIDALVKDDPSIKDALEQAKGYAVINWKVTKIPIVGAGGGNGVIVDKRTGEKVYIKVSRFDLGGGWGARSYKNLVITEDEDILDNAKKGDWTIEAGAEASAGTAGAGGDAGGSNKSVETHVLLDGGGSATATVRLLRSTLDSDLNEKPSVSP
jgi:lipid-binding SYLF domain-containing protein